MSLVFDPAEWEFRVIDARELKNNLKNIGIYGTEAIDKEKVENVKKLGVLEPLKATQELTILSGHRRRQWAVVSEKFLVPCWVAKRQLADWEESLLIVESNGYRENRTREQITREFQLRLSALEQMMKRGRPKTANANEKESGQTLPTFPNNEKSRAAEDAAKAVGLSRRTAETASKVVAEIDKAVQAGDTEKAAVIRETLNKKSVNAAAAMVSPQKTKPTTTPQTLDQFSKDIERDVYALSGTISKAKKTFAELFNAVDRKKDAHPVFAKERHRKFENLLRTLFESLDATETHCKSLNLLWEDTKKLGMQ